jgi:hypothetical protein
MPVLGIEPRLSKPVDVPLTRISEFQFLNTGLDTGHPVYSVMFSDSSQIIGC